MDLASDFVYLAPSDGEEDALEEEIFNEELHRGWAASMPVKAAGDASSDSEDDSADESPSSPRAAASAERSARRAARHKRLLEMRAAAQSSAAGSAPPPPPPAAAAPRGGGLLSSLFGSMRGGANAAAPPPPPPPPAAAEPEIRWSRKAEKVKAKKGGKAPATKVKLDTNVVAVRLATLADEATVHAGEPTFCRSCNVVLSNIDKIEGGEGVAEAAWACRFCGERQPVDLVPEEMPVGETTDYLLAPAPATEAAGAAAGAAGAAGAEAGDERIVFCVDISGSMCTSTEVPGHVRLRGDRSSRLNAELNSEGAPQRLPGQRNVSYVSRLQSMQAAVEEQLSSMAKAHGQRRAGLVTFNNEVQIVGDGTRDAVVLAGDKLNDRAELESIVDATCAELLSTPVQDSAAALTKKLFDLEEGGQTALGPALVCSIALAAKKPGSHVVLCTDGMANVGLGSLDSFESSSEQEQEAVQAFYEDLAAFAKSKGVTVSVVSIIGSECKLEFVGTVADITGGRVDRVDPLSLTKNFSAMLEKPTLATSVAVTMFLHKRLFFRGEDAETSVLAREIGSCTEDTEVLFEFGVHKRAKPEEAPSAAAGEAASAAAGEAASSAASASDPEAFPFQVQIHYTKASGAKYLRVITKLQKATKKREEVERNLNVAMCSAQAAQRSAQLAAKGDYEGARANAFAWRNMLGRHATTDAATSHSRRAYLNYIGEMEQLDDDLLTAQRSEIDRGDMALASASLSVKSKSRKAARTDQASKEIFSMKKANASRFM